MNKHIEVLEDRVLNLAERIEDWSRVDSPSSQGAIKRFTEEKEAIEWALEQVKQSVDLTSELQVGDLVVALIDYADLERGTKGRVVSINEAGPLPYQVHFEETNFYYFKDGKIKFKREELGKVNV